MPFGVNALKSLIKSELWFGSPHNLNDPFESKFEINFKGGSIPPFNVMEEYYRETLEIDEAVKERIWRINSNINFFLDDIEEAIQKSIKEKIGICSFSKIYLDTKMWSHYADSHQGICLIFDKKILFESNFNISQREIDYCEFLHSVDVYFENDKIKIDKLERKRIINTKLLDWCDEKEIRYSIDFFNPNSSRSIPYDKKALKGIILGEKIEHDNVATLFHLLKDREEFIWAKTFKNHIVGKMDAHYVNPKIQQPSNQVYF